MIYYSYRFKKIGEKLVIKFLLKVIWFFVKLYIWVLLIQGVVKNPYRGFYPTEVIQTGKITANKYVDSLQRIPSGFNNVEMYTFNDRTRTFNDIKKSLQPKNYKREIEMGIEETYIDNYDDFRKYMVKSYSSDESAERYDSEGSSSEIDYTLSNKELFSMLEKDFQIGPYETIDNYFKKEFEDGKVVFVTSYNSKDYSFKMLGVNNYSSNLDITVYYKEASKDTLTYPYEDDKVVKEFFFIKPSYPIDNITINEYHETPDIIDKIMESFFYLLLCIGYMFVLLMIRTFYRVTSKSRKNTAYEYNKLKNERETKEKLKQKITKTILRDNKFGESEEENEENKDDPIQFL